MELALLEGRTTVAPQLPSLPPLPSDASTSPPAPAASPSSLRRRLDSSNSSDGSPADEDPEVLALERPIGPPSLAVRTPHWSLFSRFHP